MLPKNLKVYLEDLIAELERDLTRKHTDYNQGYKDALSDIRDGVWKPIKAQPAKREPQRDVCDKCGTKLLPLNHCPECTGIPF